MRWEGYVSLIFYGETARVSENFRKFKTKVWAIEWDFLNGAEVTLVLGSNGGRFRKFHKLKKSHYLETIVDIAITLFYHSSARFHSRF